MRILKNSIACLQCNNEIISQHRHDFRYCPCGSVAVDGGTEYLRRVGCYSQYRETSVYLVDKGDQVEELKDKSARSALVPSELYIIWSPGGKTNPSTVFCDSACAAKAASILQGKLGGKFYVMSFLP